MPLNHNRNPELTREEIERLLLEYLGAERVVWLGRGLPEDETDGHVDNLACFVSPGRVLLSWSEDPEDPMSEVSRDAEARLRSATDARGRAFEVVRIPSPGPLYLQEAEAMTLRPGGEVRRRLPGERLGGSYVNFYPAIDRVVYPLLDERHDEQAAEILAACFPGREVVGVPSREILLGGGNIHCITQQVPANPGALDGAPEPQRSPRQRLTRETQWRVTSERPASSGCRSHSSSTRASASSRPRCP